uniref:BMA-LET-756 n=2 Tax=Brugia malayi TaxID=6279 RepID=A0A0H5SDA4_BRUMA|nr:BMA-LET-756 [Brugia malayi]
MRRPLIQMYKIYTNIFVILYLKFNKTEQAVSLAYCHFILILSTLLTEITLLGLPLSHQHQQQQQQHYYSNYQHQYNQHHRHHTQHNHHHNRNNHYHQAFSLLSHSAATTGQDDARYETGSDSDNSGLYFLSAVTGNNWWSGDLFSPSMNGVATTGGASTPFPPASSNFQLFGASSSSAAAAPAASSSLTLNLLPSSDYITSSLLANCARQVQQLRYTRHTRRFSPRHDGPNREGALFCRSGTWVEILDKRTAEYEAKTNDLSRPEYVRGTRLENSRFSILEFISVAFGLVSIRGRESQRYLCMDREGRLYAALQKNYSMECVFMEEMLENYYNLYSSCAYGTPKKPWYISLRKTGRPRKGKYSRKRRKSSHFLVVHFDDDQDNSDSGGYSYSGDGDSIHFSKTQIVQPNRYDYLTHYTSDDDKPPPPKSLDDILPGTLQQHPPKMSLTRQYSPIEMARWILAQRRTNDGNRKMSREERNDIRRRRRRKSRLEREERQRQRRRQELELKRANAYKEQLWQNRQQ